MKRQRGRSRRNNNNNANRSMESNGPDVKVRGSAKQIYDKYETLAQDAAGSGNRVKAENLRQHAEHYLRLVNQQEKAKQAAQASNDRNNKSDDSNDDKDNQKSRRQSTKSKDSNSSDSSQQDKQDNSKSRKPRKAKADTSGLEVVTPKSGGEDLPSGGDTSSEPAAKTSTRRRKAPSRNESDSEAASTAAE